MNIDKIELTNIFSMIFLYKAKTKVEAGKTVSMHRNTHHKHKSTFPWQHYYQKSLYHHVYSLLLWNVKKVTCNSKDLFFMTFKTTPCKELVILAWFDLYSCNWSVSVMVWAWFPFLSNSIPEHWYLPTWYNHYIFVKYRFKINQ